VVTAADCEPGVNGRNTGIHGIGIGIFQWNVELAVVGLLCVEDAVVSDDSIKQSVKCRGRKPVD